MAVSASEVLVRVSKDMQDETSVFWGIGELVAFLNDGKRLLATLRPDSVARRAAMALAAGTLQQLPTDAVKLLRVIANIAGNKRTVTQVDARALDRSNPTWRSVTPSAQVLHYMFDVRDPTAFEVYPPATFGTRVEVHYAVYPAATDAPAPGGTAEDVAGALGVPDIFAVPLQHYVKARMFSKEGNMARAQAEWATFSDLLGVELKATMAAAAVPVANVNAAPLPAGATG